MRRRALIRSIAGLLLVLTAGLGTLAHLLLREPSDFREIRVPDGAHRRDLSADFTNNVQKLLDDIDSHSNDWSQTFTADQMNSYFAEDFVRVKPFKLPDGIQTPRVSIQPGRLRLAFRYGQDFWSSVVTAEVNVWLVANEANVVAVELLGLRAGAIPVAMQSMLEQIAESARQWNLEVNWYRHEGNPLALVRFQPDRPNPSVLLHRLELQDGKLVVEGKSTEPVPIRAMLSLNDNAHP